MFLWHIKACPDSLPATRLEQKLVDHVAALAKHLTEKPSDCYHNNILKSCAETDNEKAPRSIAPGGFGPSDTIRTCDLHIPNGSYCHFSRSSPLVFRPAVRCNAVVARCAKFLSGTVRKCVLSCLLSGCGCDCGSAFWVLLNVLREYRQLTRVKTVATPTGSW